MLVADVSYSLFNGTPARVTLDLSGPTVRKRTWHGNELVRQARVSRRNAMSTLDALGDMLRERQATGFTVQPVAGQAPRL